MKKRSRVFLGLLLAMLLWAATAVARGEPLYSAAAQNRAAAAAALQEVDELLKKASEITGLPVRRPVSSALASRESIRRYIRQRLKEAASSEKLRAQEVALKKFGLLPPDYDLQSAIEQLLTEQAAAYYDPKRQQIYIADWMPVELQRPAIVHELTHALQDQQVGLDQFLEDKKLNQDEQMAREAVVEGAAVLAMMDYLLAGLGVDALPNLDEMMAVAAAAEIQTFPVYASAPLYLRESLLFPYTVGMQYVRGLVQARGKAAYAESLRSPPQSTAEVLHPEARGRVAPAGLQPPEPSPLPAGYSRLIADVLGELDVRILLQQYAGEETARQVAAGWRGLRFAVYENKDRTSAFLVHRSRWADAAAAEAFAAAYRKVLEGKGQKNARIQVQGDTVAIYEGVPKAESQSPGAVQRLGGEPRSWWRISAGAVFPGHRPRQWPTC